MFLFFTFDDLLLICYLSEITCKFFGKCEFESDKYEIFILYLLSTELWDEKFVHKKKTDTNFFYLYQLHSLRSFDSLTLFIFEIKFENWNAFFLFRQMLGNVRIFMFH